MTDTVVRTDGDTTLDPESVVDRVIALAPELKARGSEIEQARRLPPDLLQKLKDTGCPRLWISSSLNGLDVDLTTTMRVYEELGRADGSTAWSAMIFSTTPMTLSRLSPDVFNAIYSDPAVLTAGSIIPHPGVTEVDGGYLANGRWSIASGTMEADWIIANAVLLDDGKPKIIDGAPQTRAVILPANEVNILDTWHVSGLKGTGSHDFILDNVFVPAERGCNMFQPPVIDTPQYRIPMFVTAAMSLSSIALGIAQGAIDEFRKLAVSKQSKIDGARLVEDPAVQLELGLVETGVRAARALLYSDAELIWSRALAAEPLSPSEHLKVRASGHYATRLSLQAVDAVYALGGSSVLYESCSLQRSMRDIRGVTQHYGLSQNTAKSLGAFLLDEQPPLTAFM